MKLHLNSQSPQIESNAKLNLHQPLDYCTIDSNLHKSYGFHRAKTTTHISDFEYIFVFDLVSHSIEIFFPNLTIEAKNHFSHFFSQSILSNVAQYYTQNFTPQMTFTRGRRVSRNTQEIE